MHGDATSINTSGSDTRRNAEESLFVNSMHPLELHDPLENSPLRLVRGVIGRAFGPPPDR